MFKDIVLKGPNEM